MVVRGCSDTRSQLLNLAKPGGRWVPRPSLGMDYREPARVGKKSGDSRGSAVSSTAAARARREVFDRSSGFYYFQVLFGFSAFAFNAKGGGSLLWRRGEAN